MLILILAAPVLLLGAALSGLASGGILARQLANVNESAENAQRWASWLTIGLLMAGAGLTLVALFWTIPRLLAAAVSLLSVSLAGAALLVRELTPW